jgi:hypothetical protein
MCISDNGFFFFADAATKHEEVELTTPKSIAELPEKLFMSGIQLPGRFRYLITTLERREGEGN